MRAASFVRASLALLALSRLPARADDARLSLMHEPIPYTDVADAFEADDDFDLNVHLDYARRSDVGEIYREQRGASGELTQHKVAESRIETNLLTLGVDAGLWRDVMAFVRVPLILRDERELRGHGVASALAGSGGQALFAVPLSAPSRAGVDYIALGGAWAVLNQERRAWNPTWVLRLEGRRAIGEPLRACVLGETNKRCSNQADDPAAKASPGVSAGLSALLIESRFSRRLRHVEPYAGLALLVQWPSSARARFQPHGEGRARPGPESTATLGTVFIPWEDRGAFQRAMFDVRLDVTYVARGTNYSPLFDALGTATDPSLSRVRDGVAFYGVTESEQYLRYGGQLGIELQAARYVRFAAGTTLHWTTDHALSDRAPCTGSASGSSTSDDGRICVGSQPDRRERGIIDAPGHRFFIRDQFLLGVYAQATAMF
ncbi:MAG TPA: hypothetical protein VI299_05155 [Polyangiales bacterium]